MCVFSTHNLIKDPPFSKLDLISCRNLMIYLGPAPQARLMRNFHYALRPGGYLFLGLSEAAARHSGLFTILDAKHKIFRRRDDVAVSLPQPPPGQTAGGMPEPAMPVVPQAARAGDAIDVRTRHVLEKYSPAFVTINEQHEVVRFSGRTSPFIEHSTGAASLNLFSIIRRELLPDVRAAVQEAITARQTALREDLVVTIDGQSRIVNLVVEPIPIEAGASAYVVAFVERGSFSRAPTVGADTSDAQVEALSRELRATRAQLQSTIDNLETTNEELKSANEEFQSVNEELQSSNEELESSKEELQSMNEELQTVNSELASKNDALAQANSDVKNLLDSTEIATVFLDKDLRIRSFTPPLSEIVPVQEGDRGRRIDDLVMRLNYPELERDARKVLSALSMIEREVSIPKTDRSFLMRIRPYRGVGDVIAGVVITFVDVSERKRYQEERARLAAIVDSSQDAIIGHSLDGTITSWNAGAEKVFGYGPQEAIGQPLSILLPERQQDEVPRILKRLARGERVEHFEIARRTKAGDQIYLSMTVSPVRNESGVMIGASTVARDTSERRWNEEQTGRLAAIVESSHDAIISKDLDGIIQSWNTGAVRLFGYTPEEAIGQSVTMLIPPDRENEEPEILTRIRRGERIDHYETVRRRKNGSLVPISLTISPLRDARGKIIGASKVARDITERKQAEDLRALMVNELNHRVKNTLAIVQSIAAQSLRSALDPRSRETFDSRLVALARTHDLLSRDSWEGASLRDVLLQELEPFKSEDSVRFAIKGPNFGLAPKAALALGMAFHELATNAAKYGAFSKPTGRVRVTWELGRSSEPTELRLRWLETGGPPVEKTGKKGFGSIVIERGLSLELDAKVRIDLAPSGLVCDIEIPLDAAGAAGRG